MKKFQLSAIGLISCALCASTSSAVDTSSATGSRTAAEQGIGFIQRADQLLKKNVVGQDNHKLGTMDDLVVDLTSGHVLYAVVDTDNGKVAVPPQVFGTSAGKGLHINITKDQLNKAPEFTESVADKDHINRADFVSKVYQHLNQNEWWAGNQASNQGTFNNVQRFSKLSGMDVHNVNNQKIGDIKNLAVDLKAGRVAYVIMAPDTTFGLSKNLYALPPDAFTPNADHTGLNSNIDKEKLTGAPHFTYQNWSQLSNPSWAGQVYRYYGKQAYFEQGGLQPTGRSGQPVYPNQPTK